jgi:glycosyltransferase involved in cell wall biosynthesis
MTRPLFSIVTPCFNSARTIGEAIESVRAQHGVEVEHIVVDGASTDGTTTILERYPHLVSTSEPDRGLYDAINKGLARARGEIIAFLNADDLYPPGALRRVAEALAADPACDMATGRVSVFIDGTGGHEGRTIDRVVPMTLAAETAPGKIDVFCRLLRAAPYINGRFFRRRLIERTGPFDHGYRIAADRAFLLRMVRAGLTETAVDFEVYAYRHHDQSLTLNVHQGNRERIATEHMTMARTLLEGESNAVASRCLRRWHSREGYVLSRRRLRRGAFGEAGRAIAAVLETDPWWPARSVATAPRRLAGKIGRRLARAGGSRHPGT